MNQQIVEYLRTNKDQYTQESLIAQLRSVGHGESDIAEAVLVVYGTPLAPVKKVEQTIKYAGFWIRFVAAFVDGIIVGIVSVPLGFIIGFGLAAVMGEDGANFVSGIVTRLVGFILFSGYFIFLTHKYQATLGKKLVGIEVRAIDGVQNASLGAIVMRETIGKFLSGLIIYIGYIMAGFTAKKQALHDMIGSTVVVYKNPDKKTGSVSIGVVVTIIVFVIMMIVGILVSIVLVSLNSAREKAKEASFKATVSSTLPAAILCIEEGQNIMPQKENTKICKGGEATWPDMTDGGEWGEVSDGNVLDGTIQYSAIYRPSDITMICTEMGCEEVGYSADPIKMR